LQDQARRAAAFCPEHRHETFGLLEVKLTELRRRLRERGKARRLADLSGLGGERAPEGCHDSRVLGQGERFAGPGHQGGQEGARQIRRIPGLKTSEEPEGAVDARRIAFEGAFKRRTIRKDTRQGIELDEDAATGQIGLGFPKDQTPCDGQRRGEGGRPGPPS
jgi:hypothetical protein